MTARSTAGSPDGRLTGTAGAASTGRPAAWSDWSSELSSAYEPQAQRLLADAGLADRVDRRIVDIAAAPDQVESADVVVLHRVVCCYPDYVKLLAAAADHARRQVVFSHPPRNFVSRTVVAAQNLLFRLVGSEFRVFAHPPEAMLEVLDHHGLHTITTVPALTWRVAAAQRS